MCMNAHMSPARVPETVPDECEDTCLHPPAVFAAREALGNAAGLITQNGDRLGWRFEIPESGSPIQAQKKEEVAA